MSDKPTTSFGAAAQEPEYHDVVDYATAEGAVKEQMDAIVATLTDALENDDYTVISSVDKEPAQKLGDTSQAILDEIKAASTFLSSFSQFKEAIKDFDFDKIGELAKNHARSLELAARKSPITKALRGAWNWATGNKETSIDDLKEEIDITMLEFGNVIVDLEKAAARIPGASDALEKQKDARNAAYEDYGVYMGAALHVLKQWQDEKLPALKAQAAASKSPSDISDLRAKTLGVTALNKKLTNMNTFHKSSLAQLETIDDLKGALVMSEMNITNHLTTSRGQWLAFMSEAMSAATIGEIAQASADADEFGDKVFEQATSMAELTQEIARSSFAHGTLDSEKLVEFLNKQAEGVVAEVQFIEEANARFTAERAAIEAAAKNLIDAKAQVETGADELVTEEDQAAVDAEISGLGGGSTPTPRP